MGSKTENFLVGQLLLAMPTLGDPRFHRAVVFICAHDENGAMGLVINHVIGGLDFSDLLKQIKLENSEKNVLQELDIPVYAGGPVEPARGFLIHSPEFSQPDTIRVTDDISVTGTVDALKAVAGGKGPQKMLFVLGYAGWSPGQLDEELQQNAWMTAQPTPELIFDTDPAQRWVTSMGQIGINPSMLSTAAGRA